MSKKSRRQRRVNLPPEAFNTPVSVASVTPTTKGTAVAAPKSTVINWQEEYGVVLGDLKRTGILAAIMMAAMIVLSFVIH